jgi:hypothetical protein
VLRILPRTLSAWGLLNVMLPGDRPGIVTDFVATCPGRVAIQPRKCQISSAMDH